MDISITTVIIIILLAAIIILGSMMYSSYKTVITDYQNISDITSNLDSRLRSCENLAKGKSNPHHTPEPTKNLDNVNRPHYTSIMQQSYQSEVTDDTIKYVNKSIKNDNNKFKDLDGDRISSPTSNKHDNKSKKNDNKSLHSFSLSDSLDTISDKMISGTKS